jgi:hypothetical protein
VSYLCSAAETPVNYLYAPPAGTPRENCTYEPRVIDIRDCHPAMDRLVARFTPHAASEHPDAPASAPPRESIEVRCLVAYD